MQPAGFRRLVFIAICKAAVLLAVPATAAPMSRIVEAGINCDGSDAPDSLGPRFYRYVNRSCLKRDTCRVQATAVAKSAAAAVLPLHEFFRDLPVPRQKSRSKIEGTGGYSDRQLPLIAATENPSRCPAQ